MKHMHAKHAQVTAGFILLALLYFWGQPTMPASAGWEDPSPVPAEEAAEEAGFIPPNPGELILEVNALRVSYGLPALTTHPVLMKIAQEQANGIASGMDGHWRPYGLTLGQWLIMEGYPLSGDLRLDGYRSENWSFATSAQDAIEQVHYWVTSGDEEHTNTMLSIYRSDIGAGVATSKNEWGIDQAFFVLETALRTGTGNQQSDAKVFLTGLPDLLNGAKSINGTPLALSEGQYIIPVAVSTARPDGDVFHQVRSGQTLWSVAIYYDTTIAQLRSLNNLGAENTVYEGQKLLVKKGATQPAPTLAATPTFIFPATSTIPVSATVTQAATQQAAASPKNGETSTVLGIIFIAFMILVSIFASSLKMKG